MSRNLEIMTRSEVFDILHKRGIVRAVVHFSGGNDEGGVESITLIDNKGTEIPLEEDGYDAVEYKWTPGSADHYAAKPNVTENCKLAYSLGKPVYDKYYSFAGDFYVDFYVEGEVVWDVAARTVKMSGDEEVRHSEPFEEDL